ncbi:MAG: hypothetical protein ABL925_21240, partial [Methylococcales bacterium]
TPIYINKHFECLIIGCCKAYVDFINDKLNVCITAGKFIWRSLAAGIVDYQHIEMLIGLLLELVQAYFQHIPAIPVDDDNGYGRHVVKMIVRSIFT